MALKQKAVFGLYHARDQAERGVNDLLAAHYANNDVSVLLPDNDKGTRDIAHEKNTRAPEGATAGVTTGGAVGGTLGLLAGIETLVILGVGPLIVAGPLVAAFAGLGVGGAVGGIIGEVVGMGIPEYEAKRYEGRIKNGGMLLPVRCDTPAQIASAKDLLRQTGAQHTTSMDEAGADPPAINTLAAHA